MCRNACAAWGTSSSLPTLIKPVAPALGLSLWTSPLAIVIAFSVIIGLLMIVLFGYTSNQKAIGVAKDQLKAHLLAVRLFQDQLHVVMGSYGRILRGTGRYLKLAFMPLLYVIIPITFLIVQLDRYLGTTPVPVNATFLLTVHTSAGAPNDLSVELPSGIVITAPPVHIPADNEVTWRLAGTQEGKFDLKIAAGGQSVDKNLSVGNDLARVSPVRMRGKVWERIFSSAESALPDSSPIESIAIAYPERTIDVFGYEMNWIWLFFILSMIAGFIFKELLGIQV
jgi:uncharacterized membrane protein (DUF106 family)